MSPSLLALRNRTLCLDCEAERPVEARCCPECHRCAVCGSTGCYSASHAEEYGIWLERRAGQVRRIAGIGAVVAHAIQMGPAREMKGAA